jgi:hypothetical protein
MLAELRRDTAAHRKAHIWKQSLVRTLSFFALLLLANGMRAQQPAEPVDPTPINGETYYFINQLSSMQMDLNSGSGKKRRSYSAGAEQLHEPEPALGGDKNARWKLEDQQHHERALSG